MDRSGQLSYSLCDLGVSLLIFPGFYAVPRRDLSRRSNRRVIWLASAVLPLETGAFRILEAIYQLPVLACYRSLERIELRRHDKVVSMKTSNLV